MRGFSHRLLYLIRDNCFGRKNILLRSPKLPWVYWLTWNYFQPAQVTGLQLQVQMTSTQRGNKNDSVGKSTQTNNAGLRVCVQKVAKKINSPASPQASSLSIVKFSGPLEVKFMQILGTNFSDSVSPCLGCEWSPTGCHIWCLVVVSYWDTFAHHRQTLAFRSSRSLTPFKSICWQVQAF